MSDITSSPNNLEKRSIKGYGWVPDIPDRRDFYHLTRVDFAQLPSQVDLRDRCPPVYDQGELGSCTANAIGAAIQFNLLKQGKEDFIPSRLFIYYNERDIERSIGQDAGAMIRDGIKSVNVLGACNETLWPYDITKFTHKPSEESYTDAELHQALLYARVRQDNVGYLKAVLASGFPFVFGFSVYQSFESQEVASTGHAPLPTDNEEMLGGHAVLCVGYDNANNWFIVRNSWGSGWGDKGYFTLPYEYLTDKNLSDDMWVIKLME